MPPEPKNTAATKQDDLTEEDYAAAQLAEDIYQGMGDAKFTRETVTALAYARQQNTPFAKLERRLAVTMLRTGYAVLKLNKERDAAAGPRPEARPDNGKGKDNAKGKDKADKKADDKPAAEGA